MRRSTLFHILMAAVIVLPFASCTYNRLTNVEKTMEANVQSADSMLNNIEPPASGRSLALYSLLRTQIDYKLYRDIPTDSVIKIATDFYGSKRKNYHAAMAWYSLGCISGELSQDSIAADAYLTALNMFPDTLVRYYALTEQNLSHIYLEHEMHEEAIGLIRDCRTNAVRLSDSSAIAFCDYSIAKHLLYKNKYQDAENMFLQLKDNRWLSAANRDATLIQLAKIALVHYHDYAQTLQYADDFLTKTNDADTQPAVFSIKADAFLSLNMIDSAQYYYHLSLSKTGNPNAACNTCRGLAEAHTILGNQDSVKYYTQQANRWMDAIVVSSGSNKIRKALLSNVTYNNTENKKSHLFIYIAIIFSIIVSIGTILYRKKTNKDYLPKDTSPVQEMKEHSRIRDFASDIEEFKTTELYQKMVRLVHSSTEMGNKERIVFENDFHNSLVELREYIVSESTSLRCMDLDYCMTIIMGFRQCDFHHFFNISYSASRKYKARLKDKLPEHLFNDIFGNDDSN